MGKVYGLKRGTPRMSHVHMNFMMDWQDNLANLKANPPDRHVMLGEIHKRMGGDFYPWFEQVYRLRSLDRQAEYERDIMKKLRALIRKEKREAAKLVEDGFGSATSIVCSRCHKQTMVVVRPGDIRCAECD